LLVLNPETNLTPGPVPAKYMTAKQNH